MEDRVLVGLRGLVSADRLSLNLSRVAPPMLHQNIFSQPSLKMAFVGRRNASSIKDDTKVDKIATMATRTVGTRKYWCIHTLSKGIVFRPTIRIKDLPHVSKFGVPNKNLMNI